jgi:hypothetical protein
VLNNASGSDTEENLLTSVDNLLKRIYGYISWGLLQQADREDDIDHTLEELGFRIPKTGGRRLLDIVVPAALLIALITMVFWVTMDAGRWAMGWSTGTDVSDTVIVALNSAFRGRPHVWERRLHRTQGTRRPDRGESLA